MFFLHDGEKIIQNSVKKYKHEKKTKQKISATIVLSFILIGFERHYT